MAHATHLGAHPLVGETAHATQHQAHPGGRRNHRRSLLLVTLLGDRSAFPCSITHQKVKTVGALPSDQEQEHISARSLLNAFSFGSRELVRRGAPKPREPGCSLEPLSLLTAEAFEHALMQQDAESPELPNCRSTLPRRFVAYGYTVSHATFVAGGLYTLVALTCEARFGAPSGRGGRGPNFNMTSKEGVPVVLSPLGDPLPPPKPRYVSRVFAMLARLRSYSCYFV
eukprot:5054760-Amphidinium_carterae.1